MGWKIKHEDQSVDVIGKPKYRENSMSHPAME